MSVAAGRRRDASRARMMGARAAAVAAHGMAACLAAALLSGCTRLPDRPVRSFVPPVRGAILADWSTNGYEQPAARLTLDAMRAAGVRSVTILVTGYQSAVHASVVRANDPRAPTPGAVRSVAEAALARGMEVAIKPHVDVDDGTWRAHLEPGDPAAWFASYRAFILPWARLADSLGASRFVVGTELAGTLEREGEWRATIAAVRAAFGGALTYAASWDEARLVPFWDAVDLVGVDFYDPVTERNDAGRFDLLAGWAPWIERLERLHHRTGKRILLTEIGYRSVDGAGRDPSAAGPAGTIDLEEQADLYWAALETVGGLPWMEGMDWWNFLADGSGGPGNADFTPMGKPALSELAAAWAP